MRLVDANLLLYAVDTRSPRHGRAQVWLEEQLSGDETIAFAWVVLLAFVRLSTNPQVFAKPLSADRALDVVDAWLGQPHVVIVRPGDRHAAVVRQLETEMRM